MNISKRIRASKHLVFLLLIPLTNLVSVPILGRLLPSTLIGYHQSFVSVVSIFILFTSLKTETLILQSNTAEEQKKIASSALRIALIGASIFSFCIYFIWDHWFNEATISPQVLIPIAFILLVTYSIDNIARVYFIRVNKASAYYQLSFQRAVFKNALLVFTPLLLHIKLALLLLIESIFRLLGIRSQINMVYDVTTTKGQSLIPFVLQNKASTIYYSLSLLVNTLTAGLPLMIIQKSDPMAGGTYAMLYRIFVIPTMFIATFYSDRFSAQEQPPGRSRRDILVISCISLILFLFMAFMPTDFYTFLLGDQWNSLASQSQILSYAISSELLFSALSVFLILEKRLFIKYFYDAAYILATFCPLILLSSIDHQLLVMSALKTSVNLIFIFIVLFNSLPIYVRNSRVYS